MGSTPAKALAALRNIVPDYPVVAIAQEVCYSDKVSNRRKGGSNMARVINYDVKSDLSGTDIERGERVVIRFEYEDEKTPNFVADLNKKEADELVKHVHARKVTPRTRKPKEEVAAAA